MKRILFVTIFLLGWMSILFGQARILTGTVTSLQDGLPLIGATVVIKGTTIGVITDQNGSYKITSDGGEALIISFIGMETVEIPITESNVYNVTLNLSAIGMEEVIVTALGLTREKKTLGYAVQDLDGEAINKARDNNLVNSLSGKIAGVQVTSGGSSVGSASRITIRGNSSFSNNQPLFVIDGTPVYNTVDNLSPRGGIDYGNAISDIDPNNIETVTVLKGANAAALYGSRATNGVILITTKKGKKGESIGVEINSSVIVDQPAYFPAFQNEYGGGRSGSEYYYDKYLIDNPGSNLTYNQYADQFVYKYVDGMGGGINEGALSWGARLDAGLLLDQWSGGPASPYVSKPDNFKMDYFQPGVNIENNIAITGSTDKAYGRISFTNLNTEGIVPFTDQKRNSVNTSITLTPSDKLTASVNMNYVRKASENLPRVGYSSAIIDFAWSERTNDMIKAREVYDEYGWENYKFPRGDNPFFKLQDKSGFQRDRMYGNASIEYKMTDWLSAVALAGIDFYNEYRKEITQSQRWKNRKKGKGGQFTQTQYFRKEINADLFLRFDKQIADIRVDGVLGGNFRNDQYHNMRLKANDLTVPDLYTISNVNGNPTVSQYDREKETNSIYGSANFSYKDYLFLGFTGRNDWSSTLPADERSYFYPSVSLGFSLVDALNIESSILSYAKLRGSWAKVGGDTSPYRLSSTYGASSYNSISTFSPSTRLPPLNLKPEETRSIEVGLDARFLNNRISLDVTYYSQLTVNQILSVATSSSTGYNSMLLNAGEISNAGIELMLSAQPVITSKFTWNIDLNWGRNKSMVNKLYGDLESYVISPGQGGVRTMGIPGKEWGVIWGLPWNTNEDGKLIVTNAGLPTTTSEAGELGNVTPKWTGGLINSFTYGRFNLSFLLDGRLGGDFYSASLWHSYPTGTYENTTRNNVRETGLIVDGVKEDGTPNDVLVSAQDYFTGNWMWKCHGYTIIDGSYLKLRELVFGYDFNTDKISWISKLNISFVGRNLALLYRAQGAKDMGIDPEVGIGGGEAGVGFEDFQLPTTRSMGLKLGISF